MDKTKTRKLNRGLAALFLTLLCCAFWPANTGSGCGRAFAAQTEAPGQNTEAPAQTAEEETDAQTGYLTILVEGAFAAPDREAVLARINAIRKEACEEGVRDPVAMRRAVEATVLRDHMRPDGTECFAILPDSEAFSMETLAWGYGGMLEAVEGWYSEKNAYVAETGDPAGHYMALISPAIRYAAVADFAPGTGQDACAGAFGRSDPSMAAEKQETGAEERAAQLLGKNRWEIPMKKALVPSAARLALMRVMRMVTTGMETLWTTNSNG